MLPMNKFDSLTTEVNVGNGKIVAVISSRGETWYFNGNDEVGTPSYEVEVRFYDVMGERKALVQTTLFSNRYDDDFGGDEDHNISHALRLLATYLDGDTVKAYATHSNII